MAYNNFYDLDVWKEARRFKRLVYSVVADFPPAERSGLSNQLIRAVRSVPANLAEGHGRQTVKDELNFCIMARGSWTECLNHLIDAKDCGLLSFEKLAELKEDWDKLGRILNGYINFHRSRLRQVTKSRGDDDQQNGVDELSTRESDIDYTTSYTSPPAENPPDESAFQNLFL
jgi:four helix bundle protein